ncbi:MAG: hypothetical protein Q8P13_02345 [bacterium]|nr:hypothetical protein [bacterium]
MNLILGLWVQLTLFGQKLKREGGQELAEYGLIIAVVAVAVVVAAVVAFREPIADLLFDW